MAAVFTFVLGNALGPAAVASLSRKLSRDGGNAQELLRDHMAKAREIATQFPRLRASLDTAAADYGAAPENTFEFGLQAPQLIARPTPADKNARKPPRPDQEPRATSPNQVIAAANTRRLGRGARTLPRCPVSRRELARAKTMSCSKNRTSSTLPLVGDFLPTARRAITL
jgi:hypothetical protein